MKQIIEKYCNDIGIKNGLMLIDMPTGTGKTHAVLEYILENYEKIAANKGKIFFVTTLKKNLPIDDLKKLFKKNNIEDKYDEDVLFIDSNVQCLIDKYHDIKNKISPEFKKNNGEMFKKIELDIETIRDYEKSLASKKSDVIGEEDFSLNFVEKAKEELQDNLERQLRTCIEQLLRYNEEGKKRTKKECLNLVNQKYSWIKELYPAVRTDESKIILMSMDKFLTRNCTLVEPSYMFFSSKILDNSIVFIDEFDASKDTILKSQIENSIKDKIGLIQLFRTIRSGIQNTKFTDGLLKLSDVTSEKVNEKKNGWKKPEEIINIFETRSNEIAKKYNLDYLHKMEDTDDRTSKFIFHDVRFHNILSEKNKEVIIEKDDDERLNWIKVVKTDNVKNGKENNLYSLLNELRIFIDYFQRGIGYVATNYMMRKRMLFADYSYESAIKTVLAEFLIEGKYLSYLTNNILNEQKKPKNYLSDLRVDFDFSVYEKGFRYFDFLNSDEFDTQSKIDMFAFTETPEKFIIKITQKAKVVGLSASATLPTVTGNYDLDYLKEVLGERLYLPSESDKARLVEKFNNEHIKYYSKINIITKPVNVTDNNMFETLVDVFGDEEYAQMIISEKIDKVTNDPFAKRRYLKVFFAMKEFLCSENANSFLCLMNTIAYKSKASFDYDLLEDVFDRLRKKFASGQNCQLRTLGGDLKKFERTKENIKTYLKTGTRMFILSTYQTIGAGQNLQYDIPDGFLSELISINDSPYGGNQKDFDGIYLDKPTNIFVNLNSGEINDFNFSKFLFYVEFLQESGEISMKEADKFIKQAFNIYKQCDLHKIKTPEVDSINLHYARIMLQAIGRICRTNKKSSEILILFDADVIKNLSSISHHFDNRIVNPEFRKLLETCGAKEQDLDMEEQKFVAKAEKKSYSLYKMIEGYISNPWTLTTIDRWKKMREIVLKYPIIEEPSEDDSVGLYIKTYKKQAGYFYQQNSDYNSVAISFNKDLGHEVSKNACKLDIIMEISGVKDYFLEKGYATTFAKGNYIIAPIIFNNIYKGALGEVVGKYILEHAVPESWNTKFLLEDIEELDSFEKFDYKCNGVYIDFKNWDEHAENPEQLSSSTIIDKLSKCNGEKAIIINLLSGSKEYKPRYIGKNILVIPYLYDANKKMIDFKMLSAIRSFIL